MTTTEERIETEREFHNAQAAARADYFQTIHADLRFQDKDYLAHETWIQPAIALLGNLKGRSVLDYGCGHGMAAVVLARAGATVTAFDLAPGYVEETRRRAMANDVNVKAMAADAERLPFEDASFDAVWGNAILHHLDMRVAGRELKRVLKPNGVAVFCEPWGGNPILRFARKHLPYPGKDRTPDEQPLTPAQMAQLKETFPEMKVQGFQLFNMVRRVVRWRWLDAITQGLDSVLLRAFPFLQNYCRYVVLTLKA